MDYNFPVLEYLSNNNEPNSILATIIKVEGSSYRKEGTMMLLKRNGETLGMLSSGCLESDVMMKMKQLMMESEHIKSKIVSYDMSAEDDLGWGRGAGCNGTVTILLEKNDFKFNEQLKKVKDYLQQGVKVTAKKNLCNVPNKITTSYEAETGEFFGDLGDFPNSGGMQINDCKNRQEKETYIHYFYPQNRLFIFGAGVDARPVASLAAQTNFNVFVWDWRHINLKDKYFPSATLLPPSFDWQKCQMTKYDFIVIMTHDFQKDKQILNHFLPIRQIKYIGILGPKKRTRRLLNGKAPSHRLHSPIGIHIGADGPWEIAISILGELIYYKRKASFDVNEKQGKVSFGKEEHYQFDFINTDENKQIHNYVERENLRGVSFND